MLHQKLSHILFIDVLVKVLKGQINDLKPLDIFFQLPSLSWELPDFLPHLLLRDLMWERLMHLQMGKYRPPNAARGTLNSGMQECPTALQRITPNTKCTLLFTTSRIQRKIIGREKCFVQNHTTILINKKNWAVHTVKIYFVL